MNITLTLPNGEKIAQTFSVDSITIGRSQKSDFVVVHESLSRIHCKVELLGHEFFITDLKSSNGVILDGKKIQPNVRTPFSTFLRIQLGLLECSIKESNTYSSVTYSSALEVHRKEAAEELSKLTILSRSINRVALSTPLEMKSAAPRPESNSFYKIFALVSVGLIMVGYITLNKEEVVKPSVPVVQTPKTITKPKVVIQDDFKATDTYETIRTKISCKADIDVCKEMEITEDEAEGIYKDGKEVFVFINPSRKLKNFTAISTKSDAPELIALSIFISSSIYRDLKAHDVDQVHLIVLDEEFRMIKVFRFNSKTYTENENIKTGITEAISRGNPTPFWQSLNSQVKSKTF